MEIDKTIALKYIEQDTKYLSDIKKYFSDMIFNESFIFKMSMIKEHLLDIKSFIKREAD